MRAAHGPPRTICDPMTALEVRQPEIRTARLVLRPLRADDAARVFALFGAWEVVRTLTSPPWPYRLADAEGFCRERAHPVEGGPVTFAITLDGALIGVIDTVFKPALRPVPGYTLGYWLAKPCWGHGFMSEAARGFIAHVFAVTGAEHICSGVFKENEASLRIQEKLGFVRGEEEMIYSRPRRMELPFVNTLLTRARFAASG